MQITVSSFGFSHGAMEADYVFDLRFLPNPFWVAELKPYPGTDERVAAACSRLRATDLFRR